MGATTSVLPVVAISHLNVGRRWFVLSKPHIVVAADLGNHSHSAVLHHHEVANFKAVTPLFIFIH
jgi:hypothetical protein